jgi:Rieske Fe-S protein
MATQRRYSIEFKRQVVQEYQARPCMGSPSVTASAAICPHLGCQGGSRRVRRRFCGGESANWRWRMSF